MQATTTKALHDAFVTAIRGITPRYPYLSSQTWHHTPQARDTEIEGAALRNFFLQHAPARANDDFFGQGQSYEYVLRIVTSYADVPPAAHLDHMITQDGVDLWMTFESLYDPMTAGLYACEYQGADADGAGIDEAGNVVIDHVFRVVYNQAL
jgi:hypothetical protein